MSKYCPNIVKTFLDFYQNQKQTRREVETKTKHQFELVLPVRDTRPKKQDTETP